MKYLDKPLNINKFFQLKGLPKDDWDEHVWHGVTNSSLARKSPIFMNLVDHYVSISNAKKRGPKQLEDFKDHWESILRGLSSCYVQHKWLLTPLSKEYYSDRKHYPWLEGFSHSLIKEIVLFLRDQNLVEYKEGKKYENKPMVTRIYPSPELAAKIAEFGLAIQRPIKAPYVFINAPDGSWKDVFKQPNKLQDHKDLKKINGFLRSHQWACKGPITRPFKADPWHSGRLITPFQNLPQRSVPIRIHTLIDAKPIAEVDFNANHLRLQMAVLHDKSLVDDPYLEILREVPQLTRAAIKQFMTIAMGADSKESAYSALHPLKFSTSLLEEIELGVQKVYPELNLYDGWGVNAMSLEGDILKAVILDGVDAEIVCLPIHDAVAVQHEYVEWAKERMLYHWGEVTGGHKTKVSVTYPEDCAFSGLTEAEMNAGF